jgi:hypothetical protein
MHSVFSCNATIECREKLKCLLWECRFVVSIHNLANQRGFWIKKAIPLYINLNPMHLHFTSLKKHVRVVLSRLSLTLLTLVGANMFYMWPILNKFEFWIKIAEATADPADPVA